MTDETKRRILDATLDLVGEGGFSGLTVRAIAERAGTSVSAVSYHFGSKDRALAEAFGHVTADLERAFEPLKAEEEPARERLEAFALGFAAAVHLHGRALAFFASNLRKATPAPEAYRLFVGEAGLDLVANAMRELDPGLTREEAALRLVQFAGSLLYPELLPGALGLDFSDEGRARRYAALVAATLTMQKRGA
jgi:AcrR family transcriptional regulator